MDINITVLSDMESVFLINGKFFEGQRFVSSPDSVLFLTVLPLDARFSSYTVKLLGARPITNTALALSCKIGPNDYAIKLRKRYELVYSPSHDNVPDDLPTRLFYYVKGGHFDFASKLLGDGLRAGLGERELAAFFDGFVDVIKVGEQYFAVDQNGEGHSCKFWIANGKIDDVIVN